jgi:hypothetical protein
MSRKTNHLNRAAIISLMFILPGCAHPYRLSPRAPESHEQHWSQDGVTVGADLHDPIQLNEMLFEGWCVEAQRARFELAAIELSVRNDSTKPIDIAPRDITISTDVSGLTLQVIDDRQAKGMLKNPWELVFDDWCLDPSLPWEPPIMWAGNLLYYPRNFQATRVFRDTVVSNSFQYGTIAPSESRHGLVYVHSKRAPGAPPNQSAPRREYHVAVVIRSTGGSTSKADFTFVRP